MCPIQLHFLFRICFATGSCLARSHSSFILLMKINTTAKTPVTVGGEPIREVDSFIYLGSAVDRQGGMDRDVTARIGKARAVFVMLKNIWSSKEIRTRTKLSIFNSNVKSVLLYGCETWRTMLQKIQTFFNTCLRRIYNIRWPEMTPNEGLTPIQWTFSSIPLDGSAINLFVYLAESIALASAITSDGDFSELSGFICFFSDSVRMLSSLNPNINLSLQSSSC